MIACQQKFIPRNLTYINIQEFKIDSTSIRAIIAIDSNTVYYAGSNADFGFTNNTGKTWTKQFFNFQDSIKPHFRSLATNGSDFFVMSIENPALLYKISKSATSLVYVENHEKVFYDAMQFFDDKMHGIAVGDPTENCASIIITKDAGNTWKKISCERLPKFEDGEAFFAASNTNIKTIGNKVWIASGGKKSRVLFSADFGETWQIFETPIIQGNVSQGIYSIDFADEKKGIAIGGDYLKPSKNIDNIAITSNGGKTWKIVANGKNSGYKSCVQYVPNTQGKEVFAVGNKGVSYSNDGGFSWKEISNHSYHAIRFIDKNTAWLSGDKKICKLVLP